MEKTNNEEVVEIKLPSLPPISFSYENSDRLDTKCDIGANIELDSFNDSNLRLLPVDGALNSYTEDQEAKECVENKLKTFYVVRSSNNEIIDEVYMSVTSPSKVDTTQTYITFQSVPYAGSIEKTNEHSSIVDSNDLDYKSASYPYDYSYYDQPQIEIIPSSKLPPLAFSSQMFPPKVADKDHSSSEGRNRRFSLEPRTCNICNRTFKYPSDLKKHEQIHTEVKKYICKDCGRTFRRLHQLNVHRRIHTGEKPYICHICSMSFRHDSTLTMHTRTRHQNLKPFECNVCNKMFGRLSHLRKHQRYVCATTRRQQLQPNNIYIADDNKEEYHSLECSRCAALFLDSESFRAHEITCAGEFPRSQFNSPPHITSTYPYEDPSAVSSTSMNPKQPPHDYPSISYYNYSSHENNNSKEDEHASVLNDFTVNYHINSLNGGSLDHEINTLAFPSLISTNQINGVHYGDSSTGYMCDMGLSGHQNHLDFDTSNFITSNVPANEAQTSSANIEFIMNDAPFINCTGFKDHTDNLVDKPTP